MDQARDQYIALLNDPPTNLKNKNKFRAQFNSHTAKVIETIRKDNNLVIIEDDASLVKFILQWLYKAIDRHKRFLKPILTPFLNSLFSTSCYMSWQLDFLKEKHSQEEIVALGTFSQLINQNQITPAEGLVDAANKNWLWAKSMLEMIEDNILRLVFITGRGQVFRHVLGLPNYDKKRLQGSKTIASVVPLGQKHNSLHRNYFSTILTQSEYNFWYFFLHVFSCRT